MLVESTQFILYQQEVSTASSGFGSNFMVLSILGVIIYSAVKASYENRYDDLWERGVFPDGLPFTRDNLMEAYICLAARLIQSDVQDAGEKTIYMHKYFSRHFPESNYNFRESLTYSYRHPIQLKTVTSWLKVHLRRKEQRLQIMYFLAGISVVDGKIIPSELELLKRISELLELTPKEFQSIIAMYTQSREQSNAKPTGSTKTQLIVESCQILGISEHASMDEIKKAYRSLVKLHHPDRFANESIEQQRLAQTRFITIQKAYEFLEKFK